MEAVEVAMKTEVVLGPNALERLDELFRATILTATRPLVNWSMVASCLAASTGLQGPGRMAAITLSFSVAANRAWLMVTDSC